MSPGWIKPKMNKRTRFTQATRRLRGPDPCSSGLPYGWMNSTIIIGVVAFLMMGAGWLLITKVFVIASADPVLDCPGDISKCLYNDLIGLFFVMVGFIVTFSSMIATSTRFGATAS